MDLLDDNEVPQEFTGVRIDPRDALGHLLLVWAIEYLPHKPTQYSRPDKPSDVIVVDVVDLDQNDLETGLPGLVARHVWWRQAKLIQKLKELVGKPNPWLARMGKGGASQGYNAPFVLIGAKEEPGAKERALEWASRNPGFRPSPPYDPGGQHTPVVEPPAPPRQPTMLERIAASAQDGASRVGQMGSPLPQPPQQQGPIPF